MRNCPQPSCGDCYFRRAGLCALSLTAPCPTFRDAGRTLMEAPRQPRLVVRPPAALPEPAAAAV